MKVSELKDRKLDYWAAKVKIPFINSVGSNGIITPDTYVYSPSTKWAQGGPIIEREKIQYVCRPEHRGGGVFAQIGTGKGIWGETVLIASMRCYVASKFGEEVPDEH